MSKRSNRSNRSNRFGTQQNESCIWISFLFLFFIIILIAIGGCCGGYRKEISTFANTKYSEWEKQMESIKQTYGIASPGGVLSYMPNQVACDTKQNLLVQSNVAFKPVKHGSGCTYINKRWPG